MKLKVPAPLDPDFRPLEMELRQYEQDVARSGRGVDCGGGMEGLGWKRTSETLRVDGWGGGDFAGGDAAVDFAGFA